MEIITTVNVCFQYNNHHPVLDHINISIDQGKKTAILGRNGSGKSTLMKLISGLLPTSSGNIYVNGYDINSNEGSKYIREHCGIVFQNPDNQFVSPIVEEDIKFGLKSHRISKDEFPLRIKTSLEKVNLAGYEKKCINNLSGGQKQKTAIAGILAMHSDILIFDESTSMLDPYSRKEILECMRSLQNDNKTIIVITQNINDVLDADYIYLLADRKIIASGTPNQVLTDTNKLEYAKIQIPFSVKIYRDLIKNGINLSSCPLSLEKLAEEICSLI